MDRNYPFTILILCLMVICTGCDAIRVLTATDHKPEIENPESIRRFAKKHHIDGYPLLRYDTSVSSYKGEQIGTFLLFNRTGQFLSLRDTAQGCPDKKQKFTAMKYILEHGDDHFQHDSMAMLTATLRDTTREFNFKDLKKLGGFPEDTSIWNIQKETYSTHLDNYAPFFRTLEGEEVDIYSLFTDYLILYTYQMSGKSKLDCILIREKIRDIGKLNATFGPRIQLVLVNRDEMAE